MRKNHWQLTETRCCFRRTQTLRPSLGVSIVPLSRGTLLGVTGSWWHLLVNDASYSAVGPSRTTSKSDIEPSQPGLRRSQRSTSVEPHQYLQTDAPETCLNDHGDTPTPRKPLNHWSLVRTPSSNRSTQSSVAPACLPPPSP